MIRPALRAAILAAALPLAACGGGFDRTATADVPSNGTMIRVNYTRQGNVVAAEAIHTLPSILPLDPRNYDPVEQVQRARRMREFARARAADACGEPITIVGEDMSGLPGHSGILAQAVNVNVVMRAAYRCGAEGRP